MVGARVVGAAVFIKSIAGLVEGEGIIAVLVRVGVMGAINPGDWVSLVRLLKFERRCPEPAAMTSGRPAVPA